MNKIFTIITIIYISAISSTYSQDTLFNQTDQNGLKQGFWKKKYPDGIIQYTGYFKNNKPLGEFKRYNRKGELIATMTYNENTDKVYTKLYYPNLLLQAEGNYLNKLKDSVWSFYSENGILVSKVNFLNDKRHGDEVRYFDNGAVFEKLRWANGIQDGISLRYYENGNVMIRAPYVNGILDGSYSSYSNNGKPIISGTYKNNWRNGKWLIYDEHGEVKSEIIYNNGIAENQDELDRIEQEELDRLENNKGKFQDPLEMMYNNIPPQ